MIEDQIGVLELATINVQQYSAVCVSAYFSEVIFCSFCQEFVVILACNNNYSLGATVWFI